MLTLLYIIILFPAVFCALLWIDDWLIRWKRRVR